VNESRELLCHDCESVINYAAYAHTPHSDASSGSERNEDAQKTLTMIKAARTSVTHGRDYPYTGSIEALSTNKGYHSYYDYVIRTNAVTGSAFLKYIHFVLRMSADCWLCGTASSATKNRPHSWYFIIAVRVFFLSLRVGHVNKHLHGNHFSANIRRASH
jgi:hypothetical protein